MTDKADTSSKGLKRSDITRANVLEAAIEEFSRFGLEGARIHHIADRSGCNKERIYAYYGNKEKLYYEAFRNQYEKLIACEETFLTFTENDLPDLTSKILNTYISFHRDNPHFWRFLNWENLHPGTIKHTVMEKRRKVFNTLKSLYKEGQKKGNGFTGVSFETYFFSLSAIATYSFSNSKTFSGVINIDLQNQNKLQTLLTEFCSVLQQ